MGSYVFCPDAAGAFAADHAGADRFGGGAGLHEQGTFFGLDFSDDYKVAFASEVDVSSFFDVNVEFFSGVKPFE